MLYCIPKSGSLPDLQPSRHGEVSTFDGPICCVRYLEASHQSFPVLEVQGWVEPLLEPMVMPKSRTARN